LNWHATSASQYGTTYDVLHPARYALDGDHSTNQHTGNGGLRPFWKVVFDRRIFIQRIRIVNRSDCCALRGNNLDIETTVVNSGVRLDKICANTGVLGPDKTMDCNEFADELTIFPGTYYDGYLSIADVYFYRESCFV